MEKIGENEYKINGNDKLIAQAEEIIKKALPTNHYEKTESLAETSEILNKIIKDRSDKIDECTNDAKKHVNLCVFEGTLCTIQLDIKTEQTISDLFERERQIFKIKPTPVLSVTINNKE